MTNLDQVVINRLIQTNLSTCFMHQKTFPQFKGIHQGEDVCLLASGVTAAKYKYVEGRIHVGVNRSFQLGIPLDYIFIQDFSGKTPEYIDELDMYRPGVCKKFYGLTTEYDKQVNRVIPESHAIIAGAYRYRTDWNGLSGFEPRFVHDISTQPLGCFGSIVFPALQFILWTYPKRIYLVGCDCTTDGYAYDKNDKNILAPLRVIATYKKFKEFARKYYPDVEIISINPVGLKGIFKDEFTV